MQIEQDRAMKSLFITFADNGLPVELQQRIHDKARAMGITVPLHVSTSSFHGSCAEKKFPFDRQSPDYMLKLSISDLSESMLAHLHRRFLDPNSNYCRIVGDATIDHELMHIKTLYTDRNVELLRTITKVENPTEELLIQNLEQRPEIKQGLKTFVKFLQFGEAEADRVIPACGVCNDSYNSFIEWNLHFAENRKVSKRFEVVLEKMREFDSHPRVEKRLLWAAVIHWLKVAETEQEKQKRMK
jgi:hypothetical protein